MTNVEAREAIESLKGECNFLDFEVGCKRKCNTDGRDCFVKLSIEALEKQSEIVHCKECKYWVKATLEGFYRTSQVPACELAGWLCGADGFCLYGVRKKVE